MVIVKMFMSHRCWMMEPKRLQFQERSHPNSIYLKSSGNKQGQTILSGGKIIQNNDYFNFHIFSFFFKVNKFNGEIYIKYM